MTVNGEEQCPAEQSEAECSSGVLTVMNAIDTRVDLYHCDGTGAVDLSELITTHKLTLVHRTGLALQ